MQCRVIQTKKLALLSAGSRHYPQISPYLPPEVLVAAASKQSCFALPSADVWALGTVAFEALTGNHLVGNNRSFSAVSSSFWNTEVVLPELYALAEGATAYPWEGAVGSMPEAWAWCPSRVELQKCLARSPVERPSAAMLLELLRQRT